MNNNIDDVGRIVVACKSRCSRVCGLFNRLFEEEKKKKRSRSSRTDFNFGHFVLRIPNGGSPNRVVHAVCSGKMLQTAPAISLLPLYRSYRLSTTVAGTRLC